MTTDTLAKLAANERTELLDWVSACQSAYHIDNTPGHRFGGFGGLSSSLEDNRELLVVHVESILKARVRALTAAPLDDATLENIASDALKHVDDDWYSIARVCTINALHTLQDEYLGRKPRLEGNP